MVDDEVLQAHYDRLQAFQLLAFKKIPKVNFLFSYMCSGSETVLVFLSAI